MYCSARVPACVAKSMYCCWARWIACDWIAALCVCACAAVRAALLFADDEIAPPMTDVTAGMIAAHMGGDLRIYSKTRVSCSHPAERGCRALERWRAGITGRLGRLGRLLVVLAGHAFR